MAVPKNIDIFNRIVAATLLQLYGAFPIPTDLEPLKIGGGVLEDGQPDEEAFEIVRGYSVAAIRFLVDEGFIRYNEDLVTMDSLDFPEAQLTMKGLTVLGAVPASVTGTQEPTTIADKLKQGMESGASAALSSAVNTALSWAMGIGAKAIIGAAGLPGP